MPSRSTVVIAVLWALSVWAAVIGASSATRTTAFPGEMTNATIATLLLMPVLFFGVMSFWMPHSPFYHPKLAHFIDARLGVNAFASFLVRLRPLLMFGAAAVLQGTLGLFRSVSAGESSGALAVHGFFISGGLGFALVHGVLYYRRATGVYPVSSDRAVIQEAKPERRPLGEALRVYWWALIGLAAFPGVVMVAGELFHVPFEYFALPFFAVALLASWPYFSGRAPYTFWIVACVVWLLGGIVGALVFQIFRALVS